MTSAASQSSSASQHSYVDTKLLIGNQWLEASDGKTLPVVNPATGHPIGKVACASKLDLDAALEAALKGFDVWRWTPAHERTAVMRRASGLLRQTDRKFNRMRPSMARVLGLETRSAKEG